MRQAAEQSGVEPALASAWLRSGLLRSSGEEMLDLDRHEVAWLRSHGDLTRALYRSVASDPDIDTLVLFGSTARGEDRPGSDVDLLIDGAVTKDVRALARLRGSLVERLDRRVDLVSLTEAALSPAMLVGALVDGRAVKDSEHRWLRTLAGAERVRANARDEVATYRDREVTVHAALTSSRA
jgi:predicted nucleotidyltransferase